VEAAELGLPEGWVFRIHYFVPEANPKVIGVTVKNTVRSLTLDEEAKIGDLIMGTFCVGNDRVVIEQTNMNRLVEAYDDAETAVRQYDLVAKMQRDGGGQDNDQD